MRTFEDSPAQRERTSLLLGLVGPSASGKTFSALRLATGMQRVCGGEIYVLDTEARRALHYAPKPGTKANPAAGTFDFRHVPFGAPFGPLDYLAAFEHCVRKGAKVIIADSQSHEHEGPGGVLEMHAAEVQRRAGDDLKKAERVKMLAWQKPKAERRRLINTLLQLECNFIFCFRAKPKVKIVPGREPENLGYMPIAGDEFVYEMVLRFLLLPGSDGVPTYQSEHEGEREIFKVPEQFRRLLLSGPPKQLSEDLGEYLARWAAGDGEKVPVADLLARFAACSDPATLRALEAESRRVWPSASQSERDALKQAVTDAREALEAASNMPAEPGAGDAP